MRTALQPEIERRIGRNLLRYQLVELRLKHLLPLRSITVSTAGLEAARQDAEDRRRDVLGTLMRDYVQGLVSHPEEARQQFEVHYRAFVDARNRLVHHALEDSGFLISEADCQRCIERLDAEYALAEGVARQVLEVHRFVLASARTFVEVMTAEEGSGFDWRRVLQRHAERMALEHGAQSELQVEMSALDVLVEAMGKVERERVRPDGWTLFAQVGTTLREEYSELPAGLLALARQAEGFEFEHRPVRPGGGSAWMYRSKAGNLRLTPEVQ